LIQFEQWPWGLSFFLVYLLVNLTYHPKQPALRLPDTGPLGLPKPSPKLRAAQALPWVRLLVVGLLAVALSRPQFGQETAMTHRPGKAILMILDRSSSMLDPMVYQGEEQSRLEVVKQVFEEFVVGNGGTLAGRPNDRIGLMTFAGFVDEISPLTLDHSSLVHFARSIQPAQRFEDGTMIGDALTQGGLRMVSYQSLLGSEDQEVLELKSKILILLTDGQQTQGGTDPISAAKWAEQKGVKIYSVAIVGEAPTNVLGNFFRLNNPFLDTSLIAEAATITGGKFFKVTTGEALAEVYTQIDQLEKTDFEEKRMVYQEKYRWFLFPALLLFVFELTLRFGPLRQLP